MTAVFGAVAHGAGRLSFTLVRRLKSANVPLLLAFLSALITLLRALSGAGYESLDTPSLLSASQSLNVNESSWNHALGHGIPESRWARIRNGVADSLWRCPTHSVEELSRSGSSYNSTSPSSKICLKQRLSGVMRVRDVLLGGKGIAKESTAFEVPQLPSLPVHPDVYLVGDPSPISQTAKDDPASDVVYDKIISQDTPVDARSTEDDRPRKAHRPPHGFEVRRRTG